MQPYAPLSCKYFKSNYPIFSFIWTNKCVYPIKLFPLEHQSCLDAENYTLYGMSKHSGSLNGGHYVGDVKDLDSNKWYNCNDSSVSTTKVSSSSSSAYVLFYIQNW